MDEGYFEQRKHCSRSGCQLWQQEPEIAGHFAFTVRKQRDTNARAQLTFSFLLSLEPWPQESDARISYGSSHFS